ncbi:MAG: flagellar hook-basal body complex protein FliE [Phycisphaerales bacterium]|nr:flagellar hook-basal body complex protein FliE [Phycisphaerales bacterium]
MTDPLGLISSISNPALRASGPSTPVEGPSFKDVLMGNLERVNQLQQDATAAIEDLASGRRDDVEGVILATQKADNAFRLLQSVRNKVLQAVEEVKQVRV